jgi:hypothetical protein
LFGFSVAISGVTAIVGVLSDDGNDNGPNSGAAYLFDPTTSLYVGVLVVRLVGLYVSASFT